jgi:hypothetical protein
MEQGIWPYSRNHYKAYTDNPEIQNKLKFLTQCHLADFTYLPGSKMGCFYVFPARLYPQVESLFNPVKTQIAKADYRHLLIIGLVLLGLFISKMVAH